MQPLSGNHRCLMDMSCLLRPPRDMHACRSSSNARRLPSFLKLLQNPQIELTFDKVQNPFCLARKMMPKVVGACGVSSISTSQRASGHNRVHFFHVSTSKGAPRMVCCVYFGFDMCFAPQTCALFELLDRQKCCRGEVFCAL